MFPSPKEIKFTCSCPDWAGMCKHVAAALYGVGARLDESPDLFFRMRKVEMDDLIGQAISDHRQKLLARASKKSSRIIEEADLSQTFGIELDHNLETALSASPENTGRVSSRNSRKAASSATVNSAKGPLRKKGPEKTKQASVGKTTPTKKKAGKPDKKLKKKVISQAGKTRSR